MLSLLILTSLAPAKEPHCGPNDPYADVVALDEPFRVNRRGAQMPHIVYALRRDVVSKNCYGANGQNCTADGAEPKLVPATSCCATESARGLSPSHQRRQ